MSQYGQSGQYPPYPQYGQHPQYPYGPYPPAPGQQPTPLPKAPTVVVYARALIYLALGLSLLGLVLGTFVVDTTPEVDDSPVDESLATVLQAVGVAFAIGFAVLWVILAIFIMRAANWARIVVLVLGTLDVLGIIVMLATRPLAEPELEDQLPAGIIVLNVAQALIVVAATVLLWTPASNRFFRARIYIRRGWPVPPG